MESIIKELLQEYYILVAAIASILCVVASYAFYCLLRSMTKLN